MFIKFLRIHFVSYLIEKVKDDKLNSILDLSQEIMKNLSGIIIMFTIDFT